MGLSEVCDCGFSWSYSFTIIKCVRGLILTCKAKDNLSFECMKFMTDCSFFAEKPLFSTSAPTQGRMNNIYPYFPKSRAKLVWFDSIIFETDCDFITKYSISIAAIKNFQVTNRLFQKIFPWVPFDTKLIEIGQVLVILKGKTMFPYSLWWSYW